MKGSLFFVTFFTLLLGLLVVQVNSLYAGPETNNIKLQKQIITLIQNANDIKEVDSKEGKKIALQASRYADSINYKRGIIESGILISEFLFKEVKYDSAQIVMNGLKHNYHSMLKDKEFLSFWLTSGMVHFELGNYDSAMHVYNTAFEILPQKPEADVLSAPLYLNRANVYSLKGEYKQAVEDYLKVASFYEQHNNPQGLAQAYDNIGSELRNLDEFEKSIEYYQKAIEIYTKLENIGGLAKLYGNMGVSYKQMDSINLAISHYEVSLELAEKSGSTIIVAQNKLNLGNIYEKQGDYAQAIMLFKSSLEICKKAALGYGIMLNLINLGNVHWLDQKYTESEEYLIEALKMVREMQVPKEEAQVLERLAKLYNSMEYFQEAYIYYKQSHTLKDSIQLKEQKEYILDLEKKYETEHKELAILQLTESKRYHQLLIAILVIVLLFLFVLFQKIRSVNKIAKRDHLIEQQRTALLQTKIDSKNREISNAAIKLIEMQNLIRESNNKISEIIQGSEKNHPVFKKILAWLKNNHVNRSLLKDFEIKLSDSNKDFYTRLLEEYPDLTPTELKICALLRMNLSSKEIAYLLTRSIRTIDFTRNSIRKKIKLDTKVNLQTFLISI